VKLAAAAALAAGWTGNDAITAVAIAGAESGYNPQAANPSSTARGMWQTMMSYHAAKYAPGEEWSDAYANARVAHTIWQQAGGWSPWSVYTSGAYQSHLDEATAALTNTTVGAGPVTGPGPHGVLPHVEKAAQFVRDTWNFTGTIHGWRLDYDSEHYDGLALDVMTSDRVLGDKIARYFIDNHSAWGTNNVIWQQRITNAGRGWRFPGDMMADRGSITQNHYDHVHVDFHADGGTGDQPPATGIPTAAAPCVDTVPAGDVASGGYKIGTFNILGSGHTGGRWEGRWSETVNLINRHGLSLVAMQEVHRGGQRGAVTNLDGWDSHGQWDAVTMWRTDTWTLEQSHLIEVPTYGNGTRTMPLTKLRHKDGTAVWFLNVHNPNAGIPGATAASIREAFSREAQTLARLEGPVVWLGDTNDRGFEQRTGQLGYTSAGTNSRIDKIVGNGVTFDGTRRIETPASDHALHTTTINVRRAS
jgi:hypothetical protein